MVEWDSCPICVSSPMPFTEMIPLLSQKDIWILPTMKRGDMEELLYLYIQLAYAYAYMLKAGGVQFCMLFTQLPSNSWKEGRR